MSKKRAVSIKYTSREFDSIKRDLIDYIKRYYPNTYRDFNEASFGSLVIDTVSYVGDILSFYIDYQASESFLETATEYDNILKIGRQIGHKFTGASSSFGAVAFYVMIPASSTGLGPDSSYLPTLKVGSTFSSTSGTIYILTQDVHFGNPANETRVARVDPVTGTPTQYVIKAYGNVVSGEIFTEFITVGNFKKFRKIELTQLDVSEIISVVDTEGNEYYEVDFLSQNIIYKSATNRSKTIGNQTYDYATGDQAAEILKPVVVPRRFIVNRNRRTTEITFGASSDYEIPEDFISEPQTAILEVHGKNYIQDTSFDPSRLIASDKFGIAPSNTTLSITYRINTNESVNIRTGELTGTVSYQMEFVDPTALNQVSALNVINSLELENEEPILGDITIPDSEELKHRIRNTYAAQNRAVTQQDYESYVYMMPPRFGAIKRCRIMRDNDSLKRNLNLYVVSEDSDGFLTQTNSVLKQNIKTWLQKNKMINDTIDILDAKILNIGIYFTAVGSLDMSKYEILAAAKQKLIQRYTRLADIGEPFFITDIYKELRDVEGVLDVTDVRVDNLSGTISGRSYSNIEYNAQRYLSSDGRYIEIPRNVIYEIKFPDFDINGVIV